MEVLSPEKTEKQACGNCRFSGNANNGRLVCRRKAPIVTTTMASVPTIINGGVFNKTQLNEIHTIWPPVMETQWCGEWAEKVVVKK